MVSQGDSLLFKKRSQETDSHTTSSVMVLATAKSQLSVSIRLVDNLSFLIYTTQHLVEAPALCSCGACSLAPWLSCPKQTRWQWRLISERSLQKLIKQPWSRLRGGLWMTNTAITSSWLWFCLFLVTRAAWVSFKCVGALRSFPPHLPFSLCAPDNSHRLIIVFVQLLPEIRGWHPSLVTCLE
jgi:hypothetical protein